MPARNFSEDMLSDPAIAGLSNAAFRLYVGLIWSADDWGSVRVDPGFIVGKLFGDMLCDEECGHVTQAEHAEALLTQLERTQVVLLDGNTTDLIGRYSADFYPYATIGRWFDEQSTDDPAPPIYPTPLRADARLAVTADFEGRVERAFYAGFARAWETKDRIFERLKGRVSVGDVVRLRSVSGSDQESAGATVGERLQSLRGSLSQHEIARRVGVSQPTIGRSERGERGIDAYGLRRVCEVFNVDPSWLLWGEEKKRTPDGNGGTPQ